MPKIRVLLVDDNDETRDGTRRLLEYEDDIEIIDFAENGAIAIEKAKELDPDVILMDINMPVMDGLTATQRLQTEAPRSMVIIVSVQGDDPDYMRRAIRAGAVDFVAKPISSDDMAESIRRAYAKRPAEVAPQVAAPVVPAAYDYRGGRQEGAVITVLGPKGGVGKTTVAVNLGVGLARIEPDKRVVVVDGNIYFGDVAVFLNTRGQYSILDLAEMAANPEEIDEQSMDVIFVPHDSGVRLLLAPPTPATTPIPVEMMVGMLAYLKSQYDYIVVDTSTHFDDVLSGAIQSADRIILLTTQAMPALKNARIMLSELAQLEIPAENVMLVLNQVDKNIRITAEQITNFLKHQVVVQIPADPNMNVALNQGVPLVTLDPRKIAAVRPLLDLAQLVKESVERVETDERVDTDRGRGGLFGGRR